MPWRETCRMDEKLGFVLAWHRGEGPMTALCAAYGISWKTGYKWLGRYREEGLSGLAERSRAPRRRLRRRLPSPERPFREATGPNDVWCIDFKGWFCTGDPVARGAVRSVDDHRRVEPLPSCGGDRAAAHRSGCGGGRGGLPALRSAAGAALGQWNALCEHGSGRSFAPVGALVGARAVFRHERMPVKAETAR